MMCRERQQFCGSLACLGRQELQARQVLQLEADAAVPLPGRQHAGGRGVLGSRLPQAQPALDACSSPQGLLQTLWGGLPSTLLHHTASALAVSEGIPGGALPLPCSMGQLFQGYG